MRIVLKVSSNNEYCDGGCEFALVDLTPELAALALGRIGTLREQKNLDPDIIETYYWAYFAEYFSPCEDLASPGMEVEGTRVTLEGMLMSQRDRLARRKKRHGLFAGGEVAGRITSPTFSSGLALETRRHCDAEAHLTPVPP